MMNISEFERNKPRETLKQINKVIKMSEELKKLKEIFKDGK